MSMQLKEEGTQQDDGTGRHRSQFRESVEHTVIRMVQDVLTRHRYDYAVLPLRDHLVEYRESGTETGDFLTALLCKDLAGVIAHADNVNIWLIPIYYAWCQNELPAIAWGSAERVEQWRRDIGAAVPHE